MPEVIAEAKQEILLKGIALTVFDIAFGDVRTEICIGIKQVVCRKSDLRIFSFQKAFTNGRVPKQESLIIRSEEHTSELQSLMRISYAVFCLNIKRIGVDIQSGEQRLIANARL